MPTSLECTQIVQPPLGFEYGNTSATLREAAGGGVSVELRAVDVIASLATSDTVRDVTSLTLFCGVQRSSSATSFPPPVGSFIDARELGISGYPAPGGTLAAALPLPGASSLGLCVREVALPVSTQQLLLCIDAALRADALSSPSSPPTSSGASPGPATAADCLKAVSVAAGVRLELPLRASHLEISPPVRVLADECGASVTTPGNFSVTWMDEGQPLACVATSSEMRGCEGRAVFELRCLSTSPHFRIGGPMALPAGPQGGGRIVTATRDSTGRVKVVAIVTTAGAVADLSGDYAVALSLECVYGESDPRRSNLCGGTGNASTLVEFSARNMVAGCAVAEFQLRTHSSSTSAAVVVSDTSGEESGAGAASLPVPVTLSAAVSCVNTFTARPSSECQIVTVSLIFFDPEGATVAADLFAATNGAALPQGSFLAELFPEEWTFEAGNVTVTITSAHLTRSGYPGGTAAVGVLIGTRLSVSDALLEATGSSAGGGGGGGGGSSAASPPGSSGTDGFAPTNSSSGSGAPLGGRRLWAWSPSQPLPGFVGSANAPWLAGGGPAYLGTGYVAEGFEQRPLPLVRRSGSGAAPRALLEGQRGRLLQSDIEQAYAATTTSLAVVGTVDVGLAGANTAPPGISLAQEAVLGLVAVAGALGGCVAAVVVGRLGRPRVAPAAPAAAVLGAAQAGEQRPGAALGAWTGSGDGAKCDSGGVRTAERVDSEAEDVPGADEPVRRTAGAGLGAAAWLDGRVVAHSVSMGACQTTPPHRLEAQTSLGWLMRSDTEFEFFERPREGSIGHAAPPEADVAHVGASEDRTRTRQSMTACESETAAASSAGCQPIADDASAQNVGDSFGSLEMEEL